MRQRARVQGLALSGILLLGHVAMASSVAPAKPSQIVALISSGGAPACPHAGKQIDSQIEPDGSFQPFSIPTGQVLVVTGFDWTVFGLLASQTARVELVLESTNAADAVFQDGAIADFLGTAGKAAAVPNVIVKPVPGAVFCLSPDGGTLGSSVVHGFLTKDK
jgi:hypothetical protein